MHAFVFGNNAVVMSSTLHIGDWNFLVFTTKLSQLACVAVAYPLTLPIKVPPVSNEEKVHFFFGGGKSSGHEGD